MGAEALASKIVLRQPATLNHGSHRAIQEEDACGEQGVQPVGNGHRLVLRVWADDGGLASRRAEESYRTPRVHAWRLTQPAPRTDRRFAACPPGPGRRGGRSRAADARARSR